MSKRIYQHGETGRICYTDTVLDNRYHDITDAALQTLAKSMIQAHDGTEIDDCNCAACTLARSIVPSGYGWQRPSWGV